MLPPFLRSRRPFPATIRSRARTTGSTRLARATAVPLLAAGVALGLAVTSPQSEAAPKLSGGSRVAEPAMTAAARRAHLQAGNATMGWYDRQRAATTTSTSAATTATTAPQRKSSGRANMSAAAAVGRVYGIDVASYQGNIDWRRQYVRSKRFAYVKATEGISYRNPYFASQYGGSAKAGMFRGAYHFAIPSRSSGAAQADYFVGRGGGWSRDGRTLPGVLDIEYNPYGSTCYGLSTTSMVRWISSFTTRYKQRTGRDAVIYSTADWWRTCTGNTTRFTRTNPLWVARYASSPGTLPGRWGYYTFWQYSGTVVDQDRFNGSMSRLRKLATG